nr:PREDICTED: fas-activated serine/threonine kinase [Anolis carolinensis]|eukprot:XP_008122664.2 PREDICTED: fas-activated serine/threonine kinase [Anolis carolinensis]
MLRMRGLLSPASPGALPWPRGLCRETGPSGKEEQEEEGLAEPTRSSPASSSSSSAAKMMRLLLRSRSPGGLPADSPLLRALERKARRRLDREAPHVLPLHPEGQPMTHPHPAEALERQSRTLGPEASEEALAALFRSPLFARSCQERFLRNMAEWFPGRAQALSPLTVASVAKHLARHRLRETRLLDALAAFLLQRIQGLDTKMVQRLVFPFGRLDYRPANHQELFPRLVGSLGQAGPSPSPLAVLNVLLTLCQLQFWPPAALLQRVFSPAFLANVSGSPCGTIARRYLSLLDTAMALEVPGYDGPRLDPRFHVQMFDGALTADDANRKYSFKGLVGEGLQRLVGRDGFQQDVVVPPGYGVDFLLHVSSLSGEVLPIGGLPGATPTETPKEQGQGALPEGSTTEGTWQDKGPLEADKPHRLVLSVNDKWHYCRNSGVLVGSRSMRMRHLRLLGFQLLQVRPLDWVETPFHSGRGEWDMA